MKNEFLHSWFMEFDGIHFSDARICSRFLNVLNDCTNNPPASIYKASGSWARAKGAYRLMDQAKFTSEKVWEHHAERTFERMKDEPVVLLLSDTTTLNFQDHKALEGAGRIGKKLKGEGESQGFLVHTLLAVTPEKVALGILDQKMWARAEKNKDRKCAQLLPFLEKESRRWALNLERGLGSSGPEQRRKIIAVSDRESDINAYLGSTLEMGIHFVIRGKFERKELISSQYINEFMQSRPVIGKYDLRVVQKYRPTGKRRRPKEPLLRPLIRKARISVRVSELELSVENRYDQKRTEVLSCVYAREEGSDIENPIEWLLITDLPVINFEEACRVIEYYSTRWLIEVFHKTLKTNGCQIEECLLATADRIEKYLTIESLVALKLTQMTYYHRFAPEDPCTNIVDDVTWKALLGYTFKTKKIPSNPPSAAEFTVMVAKLGGYPARNSDPPPGPLVLRRGWEKLQNIKEAYEVWAA